jgi:AhpD family alkylhydroperoxidase
MRLREVERGDSLASRLLIGFISTVSRMRLPDAARVAFYHRDFGSPLGVWTQAAMRGPSTWTIGERELMAAMVAKWNSCAFCLGAHRAIAATAADRHGRRHVGGVSRRAHPKRPQSDARVPGEDDTATDGPDTGGCTPRSSRSDCFSMYQARARQRL